MFGGGSVDVGIKVMVVVGFRFFNISPTLQSKILAHGDERLGAWIEGCGVTMTGGHEPRACSVLTRKQ